MQNSLLLAARCSHRGRCATKCAIEQVEGVECTGTPENAASSRNAEIDNLWEPESAYDASTTLNNGARHHVQHQSHNIVAARRARMRAYASIQCRATCDACGTLMCSVLVLTIARRFPWGKRELGRLEISVTCASRCACA